MPPLLPARLDPVPAALLALSDAALAPEPGTGLVRAVGWACALLGGAVLAVSGGSFALLARQGEISRAYLRGRAWTDALLLGAWLGVFAGGVGLLLTRAWAPAALRAGVWALLAWGALSAAARIYVAWTMGEAVPVNRRAALVGNLGGFLALAAAAALLLRWLHDNPALDAALR